MTYASLDELAEDFPPGTRIRYKAGASSSIGTVHGVVWAIPRKAGDPYTPGIVIQTLYGSIGCVYPNEVVESDRPPNLLEASDND